MRKDNVVWQLLHVDWKQSVMLWYVRNLRLTTSGLTRARNVGLPSSLPKVTEVGVMRAYERSRDKQLL